MTKKEKALATNCLTAFKDRLLQHGRMQTVVYVAVLKEAIEELKMMLDAAEHEVGRD